MAQRTQPAAADRYAAHWRTLSLMPNAPACVIKAAHLYHIKRSHPDRGGTVEEAQRINVAFDELKERGTKANDHVASYYDGEPWHVLGISSSADRELAENAGKALASELGQLERLASRVRWAVQHWGRPGTATQAPRPKITPPPPPPRMPRPAATPRPNTPATPGKPAGLPQSVDFGNLQWRDSATREIRLTWEQNAPYNITVDAEAPVLVTVVASKAKPGRFVISLSIDWESEAFSEGSRLRGYMLHAPVSIRWPGGEATVPARGVVHYPAEVAVSPVELDLGKVAMRQPVRADLTLIATGATVARIESSAWIARVDAAGKVIDGPLRLQANTPVRVALQVQWAPIIDRAASVPKGKPVRPTGKITVRWGERSLEVPVQMVVTRT